MTHIVGLTGGIGSGKSTIGALFVQRGAGLIDADQASHALTRPGAPGWLAIRAAFGERFFLPDGEFDRARMRQTVFADPAAKAQLEGLLHPLIRVEISRQVTAAVAPYVLLMVPLLLESGTYRKRCRRVLVVDCRETTQVERVVARSGMAAGEALAIVAAQISRVERLALADDIIDNDGERAAAAGAIARLDRLYRWLAATRD
ncbi:MAG: dephospho-CoA kinase [Betaproteobacteria bacterium]